MAVALDMENNSNEMDARCRFLEISLLGSDRFEEENIATISNCLNNFPFRFSMLTYTYKNKNFFGTLFVFQVLVRAFGSSNRLYTTSTYGSEQTSVYVHTLSPVQRYHPHESKHAICRVSPADFRRAMLSPWRFAAGKNVNLLTKRIARFRTF